MEERVIIQSRLKERHRIVPIMLIIVGFWLMLFGLAMWSGVPYLTKYLVLTIIGTAIMVIGLYIFLYINVCQMIVEDKRVYGISAFGKHVELPIDSITSVGMGAFKAIKISTASDKNSFVMIDNRDEVANAMRELLTSRQNGNKAYGTIASDSVEELKKYKELLDQGIISQTEFEQKKKQMLGL